MGDQGNLLKLITLAVVLAAVLFAAYLGFFIRVDRIEHKKANDSGTRYYNESSNTVGR